MGEQIISFHVSVTPSISVAALGSVTREIINSSMKGRSVGHNFRFILGDIH